MHPRSLGLLLLMLRKRKGLTQQTVAELVGTSSVSMVSDWENDKRVPNVAALELLRRELVGADDAETIALWRQLVDQALVPEVDLVGTLRAMSEPGALRVEPVGAWRGIGTPPVGAARFRIGTAVVLHVEMPWAGPATVLNFDLADARAPLAWCIDAPLGLPGALPAGSHVLPRDGNGIRVEEPAGPSCIVLLACSDAHERFDWSARADSAFALDDASLRRQLQRLPRRIEAGEARVCCLDYETVR